MMYFITIDTPRGYGSSVAAGILCERIMESIHAFPIFGEEYRKVSQPAKRKGII